MELEISPEPDEDEREAIAAALTEPTNAPEAYRSAWRRDSADDESGSLET